MDLFDDLPLEPDALRTELAPGAVLLRGLARGHEAALLQALQDVQAQAPPVHLQTPGGYTMSVLTTSCGRLGWVSDRHGYRYSATNPATRTPWPALPDSFAALAAEAAAQAGYPGFVPDACLVNEYAPGAKMSLHQDRDERDLRAPIVSVSLGLACVFQFGGLQRNAPTQRLRLAHGDVLVWGGPTRLAFHGVLPLADGHHPLLGRRRVNLTFRQAG